MLYYANEGKMGIYWRPTLDGVHGSVLNACLDNLQDSSCGQCRSGRCRCGGGRISHSRADGSRGFQWGGGDLAVAVEVTGANGSGANGAGGQTHALVQVAVQ